MRKKKVFLITILLIALLCGCSGERNYTVETNGITYVVDTAEETIFDGKNTYHFEFSGGASSYAIKIIYPDGSTYRCSESGIISWSDDYDDDRYASGFTLCNVLSERAPKEAEPGKILGAIVLVAVGVFNIASPYVAWYLEYGWRYENAEPSDAALLFHRVVGVIAIVIALVLLLV